MNPTAKKQVQDKKNPKNKKHNTNGQTTPPSLNKILKYMPGVKEWEQVY